MSGLAHAAVADCEAVVAGPFGPWQPVNTVSSLAFVAAGLAVLRGTAAMPSAQRRFLVVAAAGLLAVGAGSVAFHSAGTPGPRRVHDLSILVLLLVVLTVDLEELRAGDRVVALVLTALAAVAVVRELTAPPALPALAALVVVAEARVAGRGRRLASPIYRRALAFLALGVVAQALSRTGAPWCRPESLLQGHALWHVATALAGTGWTKAVLQAGVRIAR